MASYFPQPLITNSQSLIPTLGALVALAIALTTPSLAEEPGTTTTGGSGIWIDIYRGEPLRYTELLDDLTTADVIFLGEYHILQRHHAIQIKIVGDLAERGVALALGLEQMESFQQAHLDRYNRGEIDFEQLAAATDWANRWSNYRQYRPIVEAAHKAKIPMVALNARTESIRQVVRCGGVDHLPAAVRKDLPAEMSLRDPVYEKVLSLQMMVHAAATPQILRPMIEAQIARDEAMAQAIAAFMKSEPGPARKIIVLCGAGHVAYGLGTAARVQRRLPGTKERIVLMSESGEVILTPQEKAQAREIEITHEQLREIKRPIADYLCVKPSAEQPSRPLISR